MVDIKKTGNISPDLFRQQIEKFAKNAIEINDTDSYESVSDKLCAIEEAHQKSDELMCTVLSNLGYSRGVEIFRKMTKFYI